MTSFVMGLSPPHRVLNGENKQDWLSLLHLLATHRPAHLQHDYTTILLQVGDVMPVRSFPTLWVSATMIIIGKYKQGELWIEVPVAFHVQKYVAVISTRLRQATSLQQTTNSLL